jgi:hypothetical protein
LSVLLAEASFIKSEDEKSTTPETFEAIGKILNWHLFKGGLKISQLDNSTDVEVIMQ